MAFSHRFKLEEQFSTYKKEKPNKYASRFRYELKTKRALNNKKNIEPKTPYVIASLELFFTIHDTSKDELALFNRSRHGLGIGYRFNTSTSLESTYYHQHYQEKSNNQGIINLCIKNTIDLDRRKSKY
jgi:hypothetical protein